MTSERGQFCGTLFEFLLSLPFWNKAIKFLLWDDICFRGLLFILIVACSSWVFVCGSRDPTISMPCSELFSLSEFS